MSVTPITNSPSEPCPGDELNGAHEWAPMEKPPSATGNPLPGARACLFCGAVDYGEHGVRVNHKDSPVPLFPAGTRSFREVSSRVEPIYGEDPDAA